MPQAAKIFGGERKSTRKTFHQRGYDAGHKQRREQCLRDAEFRCAVCGRLASIADHIIPHRGNRELMERMDNYQALCPPCHTKKTARGE